jgi:uncharacterized repeat protein (TIGR03837 family)
MKPKFIAIFCQVVDNYGDIGVCWRLARQWALQTDLAVTLWVDDLPSFKKICAALDPALTQQVLEGVLVRPWRDAELGAADVVIEAFGCTLPPDIEAQMLQTRPRWINLEYLSAEPWVESCHGAASPQVSSLTRYFFFPGFTDKTGGLLVEPGLLVARDAFQDETGQGRAQTAITCTQWWQNLGWPARPEACVVSLFCYPHAPLAALFEAWAKSGHAVLCLVPQGIATVAIVDYFSAHFADCNSDADKAKPDVGMRFMRGALTLQIIPFVDQPDYDRLLWAVDLNIVRGEDSFVRAQWAAQPFLWHIYPQQDDAHLDKLQAFLQRYGAQLSPDLRQTVEQLALAFNCADAKGWAEVWPRFAANLPLMREHARNWAQNLAQNGNLADNLLQFIRKID